MVVVVWRAACGVCCVVCVQKADKQADRQTDTWCSDLLCLMCPKVLRKLWENEHTES